MDEQPAAPSNSNVTPSAAPPAAAAPALSGTPDTWPGAFGVYKYSKQAVKLNIGTLILIWVINFAVSIILEAVLKNVGQAIVLVLSSLLTAAYTLTYLAGIRGERRSVGEALSAAMPLWLKMIALNLLVGISVALSLLLLIIPFFFVLPRLSLATYFLVDKNMGVLEAYKASWAATKGNVGKVWGIIGATIAMVLLMITIIGIPFAIYFLIMYSAAMAVLYVFLGKAQPAGAPAAPSPAPVPPSAPTPPAGVPPASPPPAVQ